MKFTDAQEKFYHNITKEKREELTQAILSVKNKIKARLSLDGLPGDIEAVLYNLQDFLNSISVNQQGDDLNLPN